MLAGGKAMLGGTRDVCGVVRAGVFAAPVPAPHATQNFACGDSVFPHFEQNMFFRFPWSVASILIFDYTWKSMTAKDTPNEGLRRSEIAAWASRPNVGRGACFFAARMSRAAVTG